MMKIEKNFSEHYALNVSVLDEELRLKDSFDVVGRDIKIDKRNAKLYFIDGFCKDAEMTKIMTNFMAATEEQMKALPNAREFANRFVPYVETDITSDVDAFIKSVLSGAIGLIVEGYSDAIIVSSAGYAAGMVAQVNSSEDVTIKKLYAFNIGAQ